MRGQVTVRRACLPHVVTDHCRERSSPAARSRARRHGPPLLSSGAAAGHAISRRHAAPARRGAEHGRAGLARAGRPAPVVARRRQGRAGGRVVRGGIEPELRPRASNGRGAAGHPELIPVLRPPGAAVARVSPAQGHTMGDDAPGAAADGVAHAFASHRRRRTPPLPLVDACDDARRLPVALVDPTDVRHSRSSAAARGPHALSGRGPRPPGPVGRTGAPDGGPHAERDPAHPARPRAHLPDRP